MDQRRAGSDEGYGVVKNNWFEKNHSDDRDLFVGVIACYSKETDKLNLWRREIMAKNDNAHSVRREISMGDKSGVGGI